MNYFFVAVLQILMSVLKVFEIKWSYEDETLKLTILSFIMAAVWLTGTAIGVSAVLAGDIMMMAVYVLSSGVGKIIAIKVFHQNSYRTTLAKKLKNGGKE